MPLPSSGPISMSQIKAELASSSNSLRDYSALAGKTAPDSMTEFLGFSFAPYSVVPASTSYNEGDTATWTVNTQGVANGTVLYWTNSGTTVAADFVENTNSGTVTINSGTGTITRTIKNDVTTEGSETIIIRLRTGSTSGTIVATSETVTVADTSAAPTYAVSPNITSVDEGSSVTWTITTTNVANGTTLYWTNSGTTNASDFTDSSNNGSFTINSNSGTITKTLSNDATTEGSQTIVIQIRTGSTSGTIVATATSVTVNDTSLTPPPPPPTYYTYYLGYSVGDPYVACTAATFPYYSLCNGLASGCILKTTSDGSTNAPDGYYSDGTTVYYVEGNGYINTTSACSAPPPPPPPPPPPTTWYEVYLARGTAGSGGSACSRAQNGLTNVYYVDGLPFGTASLIRVNSDGTGIPLDSNYSDGSVVRSSTNGALGSSENCDLI